MLLGMGFAVMLLVSFGLALLAMRTGAETKSTQARLEEVLQRGAEDVMSTHALEPAAPSKFSDSIDEKVRKYGFAKHLETMLLQAGSRESVGGVLVTSVLLAGGSGGAAHLFGVAPPLEFIAGIAGAFAKFGWVWVQRARRIAKFNAVLPDAIDLMSRALRAGHSMSSSLEVVAEQTAQPLAGEFALCFQQQKFGIPFRDALREMGARVPSQDLHFLITAVLVQKETGGDLTEILDRTTRVIRERIRIEGEVRTYTAQGRLTGWILASLPVVLLGLINIVTPGYSRVLFHDPLGQKLLYAGAALIVIGALIIRKVVDIKV